VTSYSAGDAVAKVFARLIEDESGQDMIEYALMAALISLGAVASIKGLAPVISNAFNSVGTKLSSNV